MKKEIFFVLVLFIVGLVLIGCAPAREVPEVSGEVMKVAKYYWPGMYWVEIADEKGWFDDAGLNIELIDTNDDYFKSLQDTADGEIDVHGFYLYDLIYFNLNDANLVAVINSDDSHGSEALVAKLEIESVGGLQGKKIGMSKGTTLEYELSQVLQRNSLKLSDVVLIDRPGEELADLFVEGEVDAILTWQPFADEAVKRGDGHILFDTSEIPGISPVVFSFKRSFIESRSYDVQAFVNVWHKTTEFIKTNQDEAFGIIATSYGVPVSDVVDFAQDDKILGLSDNKISFSYAAGFESLHGGSRQMLTFMRGSGVTDKQLDSTVFIDAKFIRAVR